MNLWQTMQKGRRRSTGYRQSTLTFVSLNQVFISNDDDDDDDDNDGDDGDDDDDDEFL